MEVLNHSWTSLSKVLNLSTNLQEMQRGKEHAKVPQRVQSAKIQTQGIYKTYDSESSCFSTSKIMKEKRNRLKNS